MKLDQLRSSHHATVRTVLRAVGPVLVGVGAIFLAVGIGSFFSAFGSFGPPRYFWCAFVGMPLIVVGVPICYFGYMGAIFRYVASENMPVAVDAVNYTGENIQPGVKAVAKAVAEGVAEGIAEAKSENRGQ